MIACLRSCLQGGNCGKAAFMCSKLAWLMAYLCSRGCWLFLQSVWLLVCVAAYGIGCSSSCGLACLALLACVVGGLTV